MKVIKNLIVIIFILSFADVNSQKVSELENLTSDVFNFIQSLKNNIQNLVESEEKSMIYRQLNYLEYDLTRYLNARNDLISQLKLTNFVINRNTSRKVKKLKKSLHKIKKRLEKISPIVDSKIHTEDPFSSTEAHEISYKMSNEAMNSQYYIVLSLLQKLINGEDVDKSKLLSNAVEIEKKLNKVIKSINYTKCQIKPKKCD